MKQRKLHTTTRQSSKQLFNVPSVNFNYSFQSRSPMINGFVDQLLVETGPAGTHRLWDPPNPRSELLLGNFLQMHLVPHPFFWRTSLIDALSSYTLNACLSTNCYVTMMLQCFPHCVSCIELGCFHLFYPITNYWKYLHEIRTHYSELIIFQRALFTLNVHYSWKT